MTNILAIGGTTRPGSSVETALEIAAHAARDRGACVTIFGCQQLVRLPHYGTDEARGNPTGNELIAALRQADGVILASPAYHGTISGLVKNAIDYLEETARDERPYFQDLPVGLITTAYGWQGTGSTMATLRAVVHSLRGWPTPYGAAVKSQTGLFLDGACTDETIKLQLELVGSQVMAAASLGLNRAAQSVA